MATIYAHHKPNYRMGAWAYSRRAEIREAVAQLQLEEALMTRIIADYAAKSCPACLGAGNVMKPIPGCECDGPRQHTCELCNGTGEVSHG
jgi:DnaJ-class molecular chaperone